MSTLKSSAEDLTLNADGSGNDIKFQSNGSEVGSLTAEGVLTATSFAGSGASLTGISTPITALNNATESELVTVGSTTTELDAESGLTFDGTDLTLGTGDIVFGTAGKGICLGVTSNTDANTLDDYEEGTWTPNIGGDATYTNQTGKYIKIGKMVWVNFVISIDSQGTGSTIAAISGLPFASGTASQNTSNLSWAGLGVAMTYGVFYVGNGASLLNLSYTTGAQTSMSNNPNSLDDGATVRGGFSYTT